jgi:hypothetical protein
MPSGFLIQLVKSVLLNSIMIPPFRRRDTERMCPSGFSEWLMFVSAVLSRCTMSACDASGGKMSVSGLGSKRIWHVRIAALPSARSAERGEGTPVATIEL